MDDSWNVGRRGFLAGAAAVAGVAAVGGIATAEPAGPAKLPLPTGENPRILLTGDAGTGARPQWLVADAIRDMHRREPFSLALGLGDNIYENGPWTDDDAQFADKFEKPNHDLDFPWLMVLGNHDNSSVLPGDAGWLRRGDHEVAYHRRSARWYMPARYYSVRIPQQRPVVEFFVLDLNPAASYIPQVLDPYWAPQGPFMTEQAAWLDRALAESQATWKIVCTHHPYLNNGPHGDAGNYEGVTVEPLDGRHVKAFLDRHVLGRCQFLLSGHDHSLQVLEPSGQTRSTRQIISGAAAKSVHDEPLGNPKPQHPNLFQTFTDLGFMVLDLSRDAVRLRAVTVDPGSGAATVAFDRRL
ncbi:metallophosphoesterase [Nocardia pseudobrasiliensis]|uniref:Calcineurin-like phosphoesterase family protein n=1 Tax=Nocardia pseudobrasiliensis TaxID=45979 RepID=A0A370HWV6_9NOCA|nr:metallophosphoesterase [Nocardia pseudobrasiliensis]RDI62996.1 calcineurin-like phosphoesterase family protein [Nocardia pseudobrasiliensis]